MSDPAAPLLTTEAVAEAFQVSKATVTRWARQGRIPYFKTPGGTLRFRREDVERLIAGEVDANGDKGAA